MFKEFPKHIFPPPHGGKLNQAIQQSDFATNQWIDLSTGINPHPWPVPHLDKHLNNRLPENDETLNRVANEFYRRGHTNDQHKTIAIPGSQWLIQNLPTICSEAINKPLKKVLVPSIGFSEHAFWWRQQCPTQTYTEKALATLLEAPDVAADIVVIINPNNPTTTLISAKTIVESARNNTHCLYVIDEAFMDCTPEESVLNHHLPDNVIVLRSLGKFFGLAGIRLGFAFVPHILVPWVNYHLGPWPITTSTLWIGKQALADKQWQDNARLKLSEQRKALIDILTARIQTVGTNNQALKLYSSNLFVTIDCGSEQTAKQLHANFSATATLTRLIDQSGLVRLGLPSDKDLGHFEQRAEAAFTNF